jgi:uncharacterized membrane protein YfcA
MSFALAFLAGAAAGALSSWGVGGGTLLVLYMSAFKRADQRAAQGINLLYFLPAAAAALVSHVRNGLVEWRAAIPAAIAGVPAAALAALAAARLETDVLRKIFGVFVAAAGVCELFAHNPRGPRP